MRFAFLFFLIAGIFTACSQNTDCTNSGDKKNGIYTEYYSGCKKKLECYFKNGIYDSTYREWKGNETLKIKGQYKNGKKIGVWRYNGVLLDGSSAKYNFMYSEYMYSEDGVLKSAYEYLSSSDSLVPKRAETFVTYGKDTVEKHLVFHNNGQIAGETFFINGTIDSLDRAWNEKGRLFLEKHIDIRHKTETDYYFHTEYKNYIFYKRDVRQIFRQYDLSGKLLYEAYYDAKEKLVRSSGKRIGDDND